MYLNVIDDFLNKHICPYCGEKLKNTERFGDLECTDKTCAVYFSYIDSPGPDGYYFPDRKKMPYYEKILAKGVKGQ